MNNSLDSRKAPAYFQSNRTRNAFTLIEMVTVMALAGTVTSIAAGIMFLSFQVDRNFRQQQQEQKAIETFADLFRETVHSHSFAQFQVAEGKLQILTTEGTEPLSEFQFLPGKIDFSQSASEEQGGRLERFRLSTDLNVSWSLDLEKKLVLTQFEMRTPQEAGRKNSTQPEHRSFEIMASAERWQPFLSNSNAEPAGTSTGETP